MKAMAVTNRGGFKRRPECVVVYGYLVMPYDEYKKLGKIVFHEGQIIGTRGRRLMTIVTVGGDVDSVRELICKDLHDVVYGLVDIGILPSVKRVKEAWHDKT